MASTASHKSSVTAWHPTVQHAAASWSTPESARARWEKEAKVTNQWESDRYARPQEPVPGISPKLYEGNFLEWAQMTKKNLSKHSLWHKVIKYAHPSSAQLTSEELESFTRDDTWAVNTMLENVDPVFLSRQPIERPVTGRDLLEKLEKGAKPLRLLDLPRELRDKVYELALVIPHDRRWFSYDTLQLVPYSEKKKQRLNRRPKMALSITLGHPARLIEHPPLLAVSRQVREEGVSIYYSQNEWEVDVDAKYDHGNGGMWFDDDLRTPMLQFEKWVKKVGLDKLHHLHDFALGVEVCYKPARCSPEQFRMVLHPDHGLQLEVSNLSHHHPTIKQDVMDWHLATTELRRRRNDWKGEGIIDFFSEPAFWKTWFFSFPIMSEEEEQERERVTALEGKEWWSTC